MKGVKVKVHRIQSNNYNTSFNGKFRMYNYHKNRWFFKDTTPKEDKILSNLLDSFDLKFSGSGFYNFYSKMEHSDLGEYIKLFPKKTKGINLPKPSKPCANIEYVNDPCGDRSSYEITAKRAFKIIHEFNKVAIKNVKD